MHKFFYSIAICMLHYNPRHKTSAGGQIVLSQHLLSSLAVQYSTVCRMRVTIQDAVIIQFSLLKMGMLMLETCRGL